MKYKNIKKYSAFTIDANNVTNLTPEPYLVKANYIVELMIKQIVVLRNVAKFHNNIIDGTVVFTAGNGDEVVINIHTKFRFRIYKLLMVK
jgi:hypothetical protein